MFRIKKLDIFIIKHFALLFAGAFFICLFVLMMQAVWRFVDELIGKGLTMDVLAQFFWYMGLWLVPQAFPLAILLSSLITFGNLGESSELTAIKAAGISLMQAFRPLIVIVALITCCSFYFQNVIGPEANKSFYQLLLSMKQKSPELEIPEGVFYDGIPNCNLYVQKKDMSTGMLYGIMIYRLNGGYDDATIILADSGMLQSTAEKKHLMLTLHSGEWFENMNSQDIAGSANIPYRRETFVSKTILLDFDGDFNMAEASGISSDARSKSLGQIVNDLDSIREFNDSVGHAFYEQSKNGMMYAYSRLSHNDTINAIKRGSGGSVSTDTLFARLQSEEKADVMRVMVNDVNMAKSNLEMKGAYTNELNRTERKHRIEAYTKITVSLTCLLFFFIGAPLGAIIRKGGLGVPMILSVLVFIIHFIFDNAGMKMARDGTWTVFFGKTISLFVLTPLAVFITYKANKDSVVFNMDLYKSLMAKILGLRQSRNIYRKEVVITEPDYVSDSGKLSRITEEIMAYSRENSLLKAPNPFNVFFGTGEDHLIEEIDSEMEQIIEDLSNSRDHVIINELNNYPIIATHAHTRPFGRRWMNVAAFIIFPLGIFFYLRMWRFRLRLLRDLKVIRTTNDNILRRINERISS
ncbi:LptF/LptG family permease [Xylanibacter muris]|uniref:YjgP/YjgQ family permease n=1 Tax=Xylanibacter muris TaxID=2736290 RepID=A0ABX2ALS3_9BACT|nr:LptF/LptG family permease [Xylanibacter muris]NPD91974.1 YjgP/YjgQ family permease [Xylanibacter muris]